MAQFDLETWRESRLKGLLYRLVGLVVIFCAANFWHMFKTWRDYQSAEVQVERVEHLCKLTEIITRDGREQRFTHSCPDVIGPTDPRTHNPKIRISAGAFVSFHYLSPADGKMHFAQLKRELNDINRAIAVGDKIRVHLSRQDPSEIID